MVIERSRNGSLSAAEMWSSTTEMWSSSVVEMNLILEITSLFYKKFSLLSDIDSTMIVY